MKKSIIVSIASLAIMTIILVAMVCNIHFILMSASRSLAVADGFDADYSNMVETINEFAESGDYQEWLVTSGGTSFGKFVRFIVMLLEPVFFFLSGWIFLNNLSFVSRKIKKRFKNRTRKAC